MTPGFWKNHPDVWAPTGYSPGDSFEAIFGVDVPGTPTLMDAISANGGGISALERHAVAALLNAAHPDVDYPLTVAEVIQMVQDAVNGGDIEGTKNIFDGYNNLGGGIDAHGNPI